MLAAQPADDQIMTTVVKRQDSVVLVPAQALEKVREVLRAVAAGEPVDNASAATLAAYALAALPPAQRQASYVA
jgi:hypothetical protein